MVYLNNNKTEMSNIFINYVYNELILRNTIQNKNQKISKINSKNDIDNNFIKILKQIIRLKKQ